MTTPHDQQFWDSLEDYEKEIISIFRDEEAAQPLLSRITRQITPDSVVADLGTGTGNLLPWLKDAHKVYAVDKSQNMLNMAREAHNLPNVEFIKSSMEGLLLPEKVDLAISISSLLPTSFTNFDDVMEGILHQMKPGATLIMLVPSFESRLYYSNLRLAYLIEETGVDEPKAYEKLTKWHAKYMNNMFGYIQGNPDFPIQKFWVKEEILERLDSLNAFTDIEIDKFEKPWAVHFPKEPEWIQGKPPRWMWLIEATKKPH